MVLRTGPHPRDAAGAALYHRVKPESPLMSSLLEPGDPGPPAGAAACVRGGSPVTNAANLMDCCPVVTFPVPLCPLCLTIKWLILLSCTLDASLILAAPPTSGHL